MGWVQLVNNVTELGRWGSEVRGAEGGRWGWQGATEEANGPSGRRGQGGKVDACLY